MLQSLTITLREGVEAALVIGIAVSYLNKAGHGTLVRWVYWALAAGVAASVALAYAFAKLNWNQDRIEGWVMLAAAAMVAGLVYTMWRSGKGMKAEIEQGLARAFSSPATRPALFLFVFLMVLREGAETVLLLSAVGLNSGDLWSAAGTALGLALAVVFGILFVRGSARVNLAKFFRVTTIILSFVVFQLALTGVHELSEQGVLPSTKESMALIGPIVRNEIFFFVTILALAGWMVLMDWRSRGAQARVTQPTADENAAERRLAEWTERRDRLWMGLVSAASFVFILLVTAEFIYAKNRTALTPAKFVAAENGVIRIPLAELADGDLHRYEFQSAEGTTRFFLIARAGMEPAVVLDACEICGSAGYQHQGGNVICKNCGAAIYIPSIGTSGGCNPIPLDHTTAAGAIVIPVEALAKSSRVFAAH